MGKIGFRDVGTDPFVYEEIASGSSVAVGLDNSDSDKFKIAVAAAAGATPSSTAQLTIDQSANGNVTVAPNGTGKLDVTTIVNVPNSNGAGTEGQIQFNNTRFISNFGTSNTFVGANSGSLLNTGPFTGDNIAVGTGALQSISAGGLGANGNIAIGSLAMSTYTFSTNAPYTGGNVGIGSASMTALTTGGANTAVGFNTLSAATTGDANLAIGSGSGATITTGSSNIMIGHSAGWNTGTGTGVTTGSSNIIIEGLNECAYTGAESNNISIMNNGVVGESNVMRLGTHGAGTAQVNRCFIAGIRGITTANANAIPVLIDSAHQLGTVSSSARYKENIHDLGEQSEIIYDLKPKTFTFKSDESNTPAWGLIAEEVEEIFPALVIYDDENRPETVKYHELPVLMLAEMKKLRDRIEQLEKASCSCKK